MEGNKSINKEGPRKAFIGEGCGFEGSGAPKADALNMHFTTVGEDIARDVSMNPYNEQWQTMEFLVVSKERVEKTLDSFRGGSSPARCF